MTENLSLPVEALKLTIDLNAIDSQIKPAPQTASILGQSRAQAALAFGVAMQHPGYNVFVMGEPGSGRMSMINDYLRQLARQQQTPPAYAYVDHFDNPREPLVIELPAGEGQQFRKSIDELIDNLLATFPSAFESPSYQQKKTTIEQQFNQRYNAAINLVENKALGIDVALYRDTGAINFAPVKDNKSLEEEQFNLLPQQERDQFHQHVAELEEYLAEVLLDLPQWRRAMVEQIKELNNQTIAQAIEPLFNELNEQYQNIDDVLSYLSAIKLDLENTILDFLAPTQTVDTRDNNARRLVLTEKYAPNIIVDYQQGEGSPVIFEAHPIYQNLFGRIEYVSDQGTLLTSYRRICPGSLHRANGGYLILDAEKILTYPFVWEGLKRALKSARIEIESPYSEFGISTITLNPGVTPLNLKVILVGSREIYYLLQKLDSEFNEMFRVLADFDSYINLTPEIVGDFSALMLRQAADSGAKPLTHEAIKALIEHSCRLAENQHRLAAHINDSLEIIGEAELIRSQRNDQTIDKQHIETALMAREQRNGRISQLILEEMINGTILIDTDGDAIGKVNGLTVMEIGGSNFGAPARITVTVYPGSRGIVDIEGEVELGQSIHSKGVMILTGYLGHSYAQQFPLAISASIAIEQSYGDIDGDSASLAELCCLISALTRIPIKQGFAVTGSINQYGEVQAVGGVNEKIEGFFRLCQARQLTGQQAAIIPAANKPNLMLKQEVIDAVEQGEFAIYAVSTVNQTLELLTGLPAGEIDHQGGYPEGSINFEAISRLKQISALAAEKGAGHNDG